MRLVVYGAGAVGSVLAARLVQHAEVLLVGRPEHVRAIQERGLRIEGVGAGTFRVPSADRLSAGESADGVLVAVKSFDVVEAGRDLGRSIRPPVPLLALQNGLGVERAFRDGLGAGGWAPEAGPVVRGINTLPVTFVAAGVVRQTGEGEIVLPAGPDGEPAPGAALFHRALVSAGLTVRVTSNFPREVWRKALLNAAINPVTADHGILNGQLVNEPWRTQAEALIREAQLAARLAGFDFSDEETDGDLWRVVRATAENRSSMLQDLERGRPTEIDAISGAILEEALRHGVDLPATARAVRRITEKARASSRGRPRQPS